MDVSCLKAEKSSRMGGSDKAKLLYREKVLKNGSKENWSSWDCRFLYQRQKKPGSQGNP